MVALMLEDPSCSATSLIPIVRDGAGIFDGFGTPPPIIYGEGAGRFASLMPRRRPSERDAARAMAELLAMGMDVAMKCPR